VFEGKKWCMDIVLKVLLTCELRILRPYFGQPTGANIFRSRFLYWEVNIRNIYLP
jgi:hypothetical protein